jgi:hypothetical protein
MLYIISNTSKLKTGSESFAVVFILEERKKDKKGERGRWKG